MALFRFCTDFAMRIVRAGVHGSIIAADQYLPEENANASPPPTSHVPPQQPSPPFHGTQRPMSSQVHAASYSTLAEGRLRERSLALRRCFDEYRLLFSGSACNRSYVSATAHTLRRHRSLVYRYTARRVLPVAHSITTISCSTRYVTARTM